MKKIPAKKIYPTRFNGYYVAKDGSIWTHWNRFGYVGEIRKLSQYFRGGTNPNDRYLCVNISLKSDQGKTIKQFKYYSHRLIAETLIISSDTRTEINHIDRNKTNNNISNLEWTTRQNNMNHLGNTYHSPIIKIQNVIEEDEPIIDYDTIPENWKFFYPPIKKTAEYKKYLIRLSQKNPPLIKSPIRFLSDKKITKV